MVYLQRKGLKLIKSQSNSQHWPYSQEIVNKVIGDIKAPGFMSKSTMSKDVSRSYSINSEVRKKWTKVFVPDEKIVQENIKNDRLSILEEECSSIFSEN